MDVELSIIIVNWNGGQFLSNCLTSIIENPPKVVYEVVVVDNGSSDGSLEWLRSNASELFPDSRFRLIEAGENLGFGRANNLAFEETNSPIVFLLNPDTVVTQGAIDKLIDTLQSADKIGIAAPQLLSEDRTVQPSVWSDSLLPLAIIVDGLHLYRFLPRRLVGQWLLGKHWDHDERIVVPVASGAALMVRRDLIEDVGGFDPSFHMFGEDLEWCVRISRHTRWRIVYEPKAQVFHIGGTSSSQRWTEEEHALVQESAFLQFQAACYPSYLVFLNSLAKLSVYSVIRLKMWYTRQDSRVLDQLIKLQIKGCMSAFGTRQN